MGAFGAHTGHMNRMIVLQQAIFYMVSALSLRKHFTSEFVRDITKIVLENNDLLRQQGLRLHKLEQLIKEIKEHNDTCHSIPVQKDAEVNLPIHTLAELDQLELKLCDESILCRFVS